MESFQVQQLTLFLISFIGYCLYYLARRSLTYSFSVLQQDTSLSFDTNVFGVLTSAQMASYSIGKIICGVLTDKFSPKKIFAIGLILVGLVNVAFGFSHSPFEFVALQLLNGFFQGCGWAPITILIKRWFRPTEIGTIWSLLSCAINLSSSFIPMIMALLSDTLSWQMSFKIIGLTCCLFSIISYMLIIDNPSDSSLLEMKNADSVNADENIASKGDENVSFEYTEVLFNKFILLMSLSYLVWSFVRSGLEDWLQLYFISQYGYDKYQASYVVMYFQFGGLLACVTSGVISDKLMKKLSHKMKSSPRIPVVLFCSSTILLWIYLLHFAAPSSSITINLVCFFLGFSCYGPHTLYGLIVMENAPPGLTGTAHALCAAASSIGSVVAGYPMSLLKVKQGWNGVFVAMAATAFVNSILMLIALRIECKIGKKKKD